MKTLLTERLRLVPMWKIEPGRVLSYYSKNRSHLAFYEPDRPSSFYTEEFWQDRCQASKKEFDDDIAIRIVVENQTSDAVVGMINFTQMFRGNFQACYVGYSLGQEAQGQGLMTEALGEALRYVFDHQGYHRIMANYVPSNERSAKLLKRLGFVVEGEAKKYLWISGEWRDHILTSKTNDEWLPPDWC